MNNNTKLYRYTSEVAPAISRPFRVLKALLLLPLITLFATSAEARLCESFEKCAKRYGTPTGSINIPGLLPNGVGFHRGEYSITCGFEDNKCIIMVVTRLVPDDPIQKAIPRDDITFFMRDNFGHTSWVLTQLDKDQSTWSTYDLEDHKPYIATYDSNLEMLTMKIAGL